MQAEPGDDPRQRFGADTPRRWPRVLLMAAGALLALSALAAAGLYAWIAAVAPTTPTRADLREVKNVRPSVIMSADGVELSAFKRVRQERLTLAQISPNVVNALIATEDHRFREHHGVDWRRTVASVLHTLRGDPQGGSTLTQQLARNLFPDEIGRDRSLNRKLREIITALRIERLYSKDEILETYLNTADFLYNAVGIEAAARTYFDKPASALDVAEAATLVGMLKGTSYYNPVQQPERAKARRNVVLGQMVKRGVLAPAPFAALEDTPLAVRLTREPEPLGSAPHFALHARKWLAEWAQKNDHDLYQEGLTIVTTLDTRLQAAASQAVARQSALLQQVADVEWSQPTLRVTSNTTDAYVKARPKADPFGHFWSKRRDLVTAFVRDSAEFKKLEADKEAEPEALARLLADTGFMRKLRDEKTRLEAGFVAIDPRSGEVKVWVGSRDFEQGQFDHVAQAARQPGSTFKPFVYGAALAAGVDPDKTYIDGDVQIDLGNGKFWRPTDMNGASGNPMSLRDGLTVSKNTITAQVMQEVGPARVAALAKAMGVDRSKLDPVPSLALGTSEVTLLEMVSGYATIAREGQYREPVFVKRILDRDGKVLAEFGSETRRALPADAATDLIDMMRGVVARGTGTQIKTRFGITADVAGKTGTTQNNTDGWFILMHPQLVAGAWVGFNDSRVTMRSNHWGQGGHNAILLVGDFFRETLQAGQLDAKLKFPPPRRPAPPPGSNLPLPGPVLPPLEWAGGTAPERPGSADRALAPNPPIPPPRDRGWTVERPREAPLLRERPIPARRERVEDDDFGLENEGDAEPDPRWQRAVPAPRLRHDREPAYRPEPPPRWRRDRRDDFDREPRDDIRGEVRGDADGNNVGRNVGRNASALLRDSPDADPDPDRARRERDRTPVTRASFGIAPSSGPRTGRD